MESHILVAKKLLAECIMEHKKQRYWYYGITLDASNPNSFANYLGFSMLRYAFLFKSIGLLKVKKNTDILTVQHKEWEKFFSTQNLTEYATYFRKMDVRKIPVGDGVSTIRHRGMWLGIGDLSWWTDNGE